MKERVKKQSNRKGNGMGKNLSSQKSFVRRRKDSGFSLLEYVAGATVLVVVVWGAMTVLGNNMSSLVESLGRWATARAADIDSASGVR